MAFGSDVITITGCPDQVSTVEIRPDSQETLPTQPPIKRPAPQPLPSSGPSQAWQNAAGKPEVAAPLAQLPAGVALERIDEPVYFDASRKLLLYRGFMCHGSYLYLRKLSTDLAYLAAVDQLFVLTASAPTARRAYGLLAGVASLIASATAAGLWWWLR
jgi:hypothetical protein